MRNIDFNITGSDADLMQQLEEHTHFADNGSLIFANLVEFTVCMDTDGSPWICQSIEWFDNGIASVVKNLLEDDLLIITADHGNDPTWSGTDHTEQVPILLHGKANLIQSEIDLNVIAALASVTWGCN